MMIIVRISIIALPEKRKEVLQTLLSLLEAPNKENGCLSYDIFANIENENFFNVISEWESRQHVDQYMRSDRFSVLFGTKSLLCEPLRIQIVTVANAEGIEAVNVARKRIR